MIDRCWWCHAKRCGLVAALLVVAAFIGLAIRDRVEEGREKAHADGLVRSLLNAEAAQTPDIIKQMSAYRKWTDPLLRTEIDTAGPKSRQKLRASVALLPNDPGQVDYLYSRLLDAELHEVPVIRDALAPHKDALIGKLWVAVETPKSARKSNDCERRRHWRRIFRQ